MDILGLGLIQINDWLLLLLGTITAIYFYLTWNFNYWKSRGISGPQPVPLLGNFYPVMKKGLYNADIEWTGKYGDTFGAFTGRYPNLNSRDPEFLRQLFVKQHMEFPGRRSLRGDEMSDLMLQNANGDLWKTLRSLMSPAFSTGKLKVMASQINECAQELVDNLKTKADAGDSVELKEMAGNYTMDVIATTAFGIKVDSQKDNENEFVKMAKKVFDINIANPIFLVAILCPSLMPHLAKFGISFFPKDVKDFFAEATNQTMDARQKSGESRLDFIQLMMNAHKEMLEEKSEEKDEEHKDVFQGVQRRSLTRKEIVAQGFLFFIAGYDTTATAVAFLLYNLALNTDIQEKLHEEIVNVAGDKEINLSTLQDMHLLDMCCQESLRMYPPAQRTDRVCAKDTNINGIDIPKGMVVSALIRAAHYNPKVWPEPEKFDPYRFTPEEKAKHGPYDWIPFGAGPRNCLAMRLALTELKIAVAYVVRKYKVMRNEKTEVPVQLKHTAFTSPKNGLWVEVQNRT